MVNTYAAIGFITIAAICVLIVGFVIVSVVKYIFFDKPEICEVHTLPNGRIKCIKDDMVMDVGLCKHCIYFHKYNEQGRQYVECKYGR